MPDEPNPHPASRYAADPDGILLKYGPEAVMEHYYHAHTLLIELWGLQDGRGHHACLVNLPDEEILGRLRKEYENLQRTTAPVSES